MTDPYVDGGRLLTKTAIEQCPGSKMAKALAARYGIKTEEAYRSAFYWGIRLGKSTGECHGDYGEFVQDYVDGRLSNDGLAD